MKTLLLILSLSYYLSISAQTEKWGFLAIKSVENKDYVISKIIAMSGVRYMGYCPNHQILLYKFNTEMYSTVSNFISVLKANDEFISDKILEKQNNDDENIAKEFINQCDFDEQSSSNIKREIEKN